MVATLVHQLVADKVDRLLGVDRTATHTVRSNAVGAHSTAIDLASDTSAALETQ